jgi:hypothetical protein
MGRRQLTAIRPETKPAHCECPLHPGLTNCRKIALAISDYFCHAGSSDRDLGFEGSIELKIKILVEARETYRVSTG